MAFHDIKAKYIYFANLIDIFKTIKKVITLTFYLRY